MGEVAVNTRDIQRNVRGQIVSYPAPNNTLYGKVYFIDQADGTQTKPSRYSIADLVNNFDIEIKELSFPQLSINPDQIVRQRARQGAIVTSTAQFNVIQSENGIAWPPFSVLDDGTRVPFGYGFPNDVYPAFGGEHGTVGVGPGSGGINSGGSSSGYGGTSNVGVSSGTGYFGGFGYSFNPFGTLPPPAGGGGMGPGGPSPS